MTFFPKHLNPAEDMYKLIYDTYRGRVFNYIAGKVRSRNDVRDIAQNVFFHLWEYKQSLGDTNTENIIFKTCNQEISKFFKTQRKQALTNDHDILERPDDSVDQLDAKLIKEEQLIAVQSSIEQLPPPTKQMFTMNKLEGITQEKIAIQFNLPKKLCKNTFPKRCFFLKTFIKTLKKS